MWGWIRRATRKLGDLVDPPCKHPLEARRPSLIRHYSTRPPSPAWFCRSCGTSHQVTLQEFYALFGRMPWEAPTRLE